MLFWLVVAMTGVLVWIQNEMVMSESAYKTILGNQLDQTRIRELTEMIRLFSAASLLLIPVGLWLRMAVVSLVIQFGLIMTNIEVAFRNVFRIAVLSYFPLLFGAILKIVYLLRLDPTEINEYALADFPLSLTALVDSNDYSVGVYGFLAGMNVSEIGWIGVLSTYLNRHFSITRSNSILFASTVWTVILIFQWIIFIYVKSWLGF